METETLTPPSPTIAPADRAIALRIAGADLLLRGRFGQWLPLVLADGQDGAAADSDSDASARLSTAQLLFDVTSNRGAAPTGTGAQAESELFSFTASKVEVLGQQAYRLKGRLRAHGESGEVEATLRSPAAHTPFFVIVFRFDRDRFARLWAALQERIDANAEGELRPTAWLRAPALAAA